MADKEDTQPARRTKYVQPKPRATSRFRKTTGISGAVKDMDGTVIGGYYSDGQAFGTKESQFKSAAPAAQPVAPGATAPATGNVLNARQSLFRRMQGASPDQLAAMRGQAAALGVTDSGWQRATSKLQAAPTAPTQGGDQSAAAMGTPEQQAIIRQMIVEGSNLATASTGNDVSSQAAAAATPPPIVGPPAPARPTSPPFVGPPASATAGSPFRRNPQAVPDGSPVIARPAPVNGQRMDPAVQNDAGTAKVRVNSLTGLPFGFRPGDAVPQTGGSAMQQRATDSQTRQAAAPPLAAPAPAPAPTSIFRRGPASQPTPTGPTTRPDGYQARSLQQDSAIQAESAKARQTGTLGSMFRRQGKPELAKAFPTPTANPPGLRAVAPTPPIQDPAKKRSVFARTGR